MDLRPGNGAGLFSKKDKWEVKKTGKIRKKEVPVR